MANKQTWNVEGISLYVIHVISNRGQGQANIECCEDIVVRDPRHQQSRTSPKAVDRAVM